MHDADEATQPPCGDPAPCHDTKQHADSYTHPESGTYFSFDFGQKRIGLAVGHSDTKSANPLAVIRNINGRPEWHRIDELVEEWKPCGIVVGLPVFESSPLNESDWNTNSHTDNTRRVADNRNKQQLQLSAAFSKRLHKRYKIPVYRCDERYSSIEAARLLAENRNRGNRKKVGREDLDKVAAAIILNQWFDNEFE